MDIRKLQKITVSALEDIKGEDITVINTIKLTALFDRIVVATGNSNRQTRALARSVQDKVKEAGGEVYGVEGDDSGEWVLVDLGDIIVHVMLPAVRAHYNLEELWEARPTRAEKLGAGGTASAAPAKRAAAKPAAKAPASRAPSAKRSTAEPKATPARSRRVRSGEA
ncbi:MAG: ribosome silencing factor [Gammaproteobacteria bacterium]|nr:ribosome silencing factor [Gammaproteobacteria bacterium]MBU1647660.1 ribosome silencing factor [Gammaproteobacteria bacterium]MBU1971806.1 ribosome silencing factor [Gammaproteobacteria bacterium]